MRVTERYQKRISFTKECAACSTFPHQVHGPGQGAGAGEGPRVHASALVVEAAGAKCPAPQGRETRVSREPVMTTGMGRGL